MNKNTTVVKGGASFMELLQVAFIVLKLCGVIKWSWWWVLAPLWASIGLTVVILLVALIVCVFL